MDYNFIIIVSVGAGLIILVIFLIFSHLNKTSHPSYTDDVAPTRVEENAHRRAPREETTHSNMSSNVTAVAVGSGSTGTFIWNETLPTCDVKEDTYISYVFLHSIPGVEDLPVRTNLGKFEFK